MGVGVSVFTITLGLILKFAINPDAMTDPVDIHVVGVILIIVGGVSFALQLLMMSRTQPSRPRFPSTERSEHTYGEDNPPRP